MELNLPDDIVQRLRAARAVTVLTGGGLSNECGAPTFIEAQTDEWRDYEPQELATVNAFLLRPRLVWEWFAHRRALIENLQPGPAHYALVDLEQRLPKYMLITQAIDGMHWRAGTREMIEIHGNLSRYKCFEDGQPIEAWEDTGEVPPRCPKCGNLLRPDVVWFGEGVQTELVRRCETAARCDLFLCIGVKTMVDPAASLPLMAKRYGAFVLEVGREPTSFTVFADYAIHGQANEIVPVLAPLIGADCEPLGPEELPIL